MILGIIEHDRGVIEATSLQMLTLGRDLAEQTGTDLEAVLIGDDAASLEESIKPFGVATIHRVTHPQLDDYAPAAWAEASVQLGRARGALAILAPGSDRGNEVLAHMAAKTGLAMAANCARVEPGEVYRVVRLRWGSSLLEEAELSGDIKLLSVAPHTIVATESRRDDVTVEEFEPVLSDADLRVKVTRRDETASSGVTLKTARVVIGGGRGVGSAAGFAVLEALAESLGGIVGGSRVATNNGWRPHTNQVGLTGTRIAPQLYIACGISGAIQHLVGCKGAKRILVINTDRDAPFFSRADYGVVGDLHEVVPAVVAELKKRG
jgi:electron transfer flavoprotein alpha subunit